MEVVLDSNGDAEKMKSPPAASSTMDSTATDDGMETDDASRQMKQLSLECQQHCSEHFNSNQETSKKIEQLQEKIRKYKVALRRLKGRLDERDGIIRSVAHKGIQATDYGQQTPRSPVTNGIRDRKKEQRAVATEALKQPLTNGIHHNHEIDIGNANRRQQRARKSVPSRQLLSPSDTFGSPKFVGKPLSPSPTRSNSQQRTISPIVSDNAFATPLLKRPKLHHTTVDRTEASTSKPSEDETAAVVEIDLTSEGPPKPKPAIVNSPISILDKVTNPTPTVLRTPDVAIATPSPQNRTASPGHNLQTYLTGTRRPHPLPFPISVTTNREQNTDELPPLPAKLILVAAPSQNGIAVVHLSWRRTMKQLSSSSGMMSMAKPDAVILYFYTKSSAEADPSKNWSTIVERKYTKEPMIEVDLARDVKPNEVVFFSVRVRDIHGRFGPFAEPKCVAFSDTGQLIFLQLPSEL